MSFDSWELIDAAKTLVASEHSSESHCARAISTAYYAMFQHVCCSAAEIFVGGNSNELTRAKLHLMRSIQHKPLEKRLGMAQNRTNVFFQYEIVSFCNVFCTLQKMRHDADYNKFRTFTRNEANLEISRAECAMQEYDTVDKKHRTAFMVWAVIEKPKR